MCDPSQLLSLKQALSRMYITTPTLHLPLQDEHGQRRSWQAVAELCAKIRALHDVAHRWACVLPRHGLLAFMVMHAARQIAALSRC